MKFFHVFLIFYYLFGVLSAQEEECVVTYDNSEGALINVGWSDPDESTVLEQSSDLINWAIIDTSNYSQNGIQSSVSLPYSRQTNFYRCRSIGSDNIYVIGDSISERDTWTDNLYNLTGRHIFPQAVGGQVSPGMVSQTRGLELVEPQALVASHVEGEVVMRWRRHVTFRSHLIDFEPTWGLQSKFVSNPNQVEVYNNGDLIGFAEKIVKPIITNYQDSAHTIICNNHGLSEGDPVVFMADNSIRPSDLNISHSVATWNTSSNKTPSALVDYRVYYATNTTSNTFEIKKLLSSNSSLDLGSDAGIGAMIEIGWEFKFEHEGGGWNLTWKPRTDFDDWVWILEVSANDMPNFSVLNVTIPNTLTLISQMIERNKKFVILCPPSGHHNLRGPGSFNWNNYYDDYIPYIKENFPDQHIDTMAILNNFRTSIELRMLDNADIPELLWIRGSPANQGSWIFSKKQFPNSSQMWVGPGYIPLQFRIRFSDPIHLNEQANQIIADSIFQLLQSKGW